MRRQDIINKIKSRDPEMYAKTEDEQARLLKLFGMKKHKDIKCPYCHVKVETLYQGIHSGSSRTCQHCGKLFCIPPLAFSRIKT